MDQTLTQDGIAIVSMAGWMSVEELAEERWETPGNTGSHEPPVEISGNELPF